MLIKTLRLALPLCFAAFLLCLNASRSLDNKAIIKMTAAGLTDDAIIGVIEAQPGEYRLRADDMLQLKASKVSTRVVEAMVKRGSATTGVRLAAPMPALRVYPQSR